MVIVARVARGGGTDMLCIFHEHMQTDSKEHFSLDELAFHLRRGALGKDCVTIVKVH